MSAFREVEVYDGETRIVGDILTRQLEKSVQQTCSHKNAIAYSSGRTPDTGEYFTNYRCPDCAKGYTIYGEPE